MHHKAKICGALLLSGVLTLATAAQAYERQWHAGGQLGYAMVTFPEDGAGSVDGLGGGLHLTYGLTDAVNLRVQLDVAAFDLPEPLTSATIWYAAGGAEYVVDIMSWLPYFGAMIGPVDVLVEGQDHAIHLGMEIPAGIGYRLHDNFHLMAEGRYRLFLLGDDASPVDMLMLFGRAEVVWGG